MLYQAEKLSSLVHCSKRPEHLCDTNLPSVPLFQHIYKFHGLENIHILNVQANSPSLHPMLIENALAIVRHCHFNEVLSIYPDGSVHGSLWGLSPSRLLNYGDFYLKQQYCWCQC